MTDIIIHKHSTTSGDAPEPAELNLGELAIQAADGHIYLKKTDGTVNRVTMLPGGTGQQVLYKTGSGDYALGWGTITSTLLGNTLYGEVTSYVDAELASVEGTATTKTTGAITIPTGTPAPVSVTLDDTSFIDNSTSIKGVLGSVYGTLARDSAGNYTFTADADPGSSVVLAAGTRFASVILPSGLGYSINERVSYKPQRTYFASGEIFGSYDGRDGSAEGDPDWSINGSGHLVINDSTFSGNFYRFWRVGHYWDVNHTLEVTIKAKCTTSNQTNGVTFCIDQADSDNIFFLYAKNGAIGLFDGTGASVSGNVTTQAQMAYDVDTLATMKVRLKPNGTGTITAIHPSNGNEFVFEFSGYPTDPGQVCPGWRRPDNGVIEYFEVNHDLLEVKDELTALENELTALETKITVPLAGVAIPSGFTFVPPFNIKKAGTSGPFSTDYQATPLSTTAAYYVDPVNGDNTNNGSKYSPYATLKQAITAMNSAGSSRTIYLKSGEYEFTDVGTLPTATQNFNLICQDSDPAILTLASTESSGWAQNSTHSNVYEKTLTLGDVDPLWAYDTGNLDVYGEPIPLTVKASIADVSSAENSCFVNGSIIYIRMKGDASPNSSTRIRVLRDMPGINTGNRLFYMENIHFLGGNTSSLDIGNFTATVVAKNCRFSYAYANDVIDVDSNANTCIFINTTASYSRLADGFNYHDGCDAVEIDCIGHHNGLEGGPNNNGSTQHDGGRIIRINGDYSFNQNRNIHDINDDTEAWMLGCQAGDAQIVGGTSYTSANFMAGRDGETDDTHAFLDSCVSRGGSVTDFAVYPGSTMKVRATDTSSFKSIIQTGTLEGY